MDDYRQRAHQKYLEQKKIKIQEDDTTIKEQLIKEQEEKLQKEKDAIKKQVYVQGQVLIIDETISSYKIDKTDDNIMMILTIVHGCIENIQSLWSPDDIKTIINLVIGFSNDVDTNNENRPKGLDTIANVKILKEAFENLFKILNLEVEIQTLDTDKDEEIAKKLQETLNPKRPNTPRLLPHDNDELLIDRPDNHLFDDNDMNDLNDEDFARRLQDEINKPKKEKPKKEKPPILSSRYNGMNSDDFIDALLKEKVK
jgi:hypothetical protein